MQIPEVLLTQAQKTAFISVTCARSDLQNVMDPGIRELVAALQAQNIAPVAPWFTHHLRAPTDSFDFKICFPVAESVTPVGRVRPGELPAAKVARAVYRGPYEGLAGAWGTLRAWVSANGYSPAPDLWEAYLCGPESSANPQDWQTQLNQPLLG